MNPLQKRINRRKISELKAQRREHKLRKAVEKTERHSLWRRTEKFRRGLVHVVFSRAALIIGMVLLQILLIVVTFELLPQFATHIQIFYRLIALCIVIAIVNEQGADATKLTWLVFFVVAPLAATFFYLYVRYDVGTRKIKHRLDELRIDTSSYLTQDLRVRRHLREKRPDMSGLSYYLARRVGFPTYEQTAAEYFPSGEDFFNRLIPELEAAERYIFLEFFIIDFGKLWDRVLEILQRKVKEGVEVRLMYDGMNSLAKTPINYWKEIDQTGIRCKVFNQVRPLFTSVQNNRDHRKIVVIDGRIAYTGGVNIADEYVNERERFGYWKDAGIRFEGDAVKSFIIMFMQMWHVSEERLEDLRPYLEAVAPAGGVSPNVVSAGGVSLNVAPAGGDEMGLTRVADAAQLDRALKPVRDMRPADFVTPYGDSPYDNEDVGRTVYLYLIEHAKDYVHIMTPYLVLDKGVRRTLTQAAKCGIQIVIIMPNIPDKKYAYYLARS